jgi:hypothetical protein
MSESRGALPAEREQIVKVMGLIQEDCKADAMTIDGKPFDGRTVAVQFGNILASISALADAISRLAASGTDASSPEGET